MRPYGVWAIADELRVAAGGAGGSNGGDAGTGSMRGFISDHYVSVSLYASWSMLPLLIYTCAERGN